MGKGNSKKKRGNTEKKVVTIDVFSKDGRSLFGEESSASKSQSMESDDAGVERNKEVINSIEGRADGGKENLGILPDQGTQTAAEITINPRVSGAVGFAGAVGFHKAEGSLSDDESSGDAGVERSNEMTRSRTGRAAGDGGTSGFYPIKRTPKKA